MKKVLKEKPKYRKLLLFLIPLALLLMIFTRLYNLDMTARFTQDESSDLVRMHQYYTNKKVTLVGPISNNNEKVFGSLTYYMLMPFAVIGNFEPVSPAYGAVFWGTFTVVLLLLITKKINLTFLPFIVILGIFWYPLLETSRWAWNPNLVPFWIALGIYFYFRKTQIGYLFSGIFFGLSFHNHYIAIIATGVFGITTLIKLFFEKQYKHAAFLFAGFIIPFIPFVIFDLRHPPGLFFSKYLSSGQIENTKASSIAQMITDIGQNISLFGNYLTQNNILAILLGIVILAIVTVDIYSKKKKHMLFLLPVVAQILAGAVMDSLQTRYLIPALIFFVVWLIMPRERIGLLLTRAAFGILIIGSLLSFYPQIHHVEVYPDVRTISQADKIIVDVTRSNKIENANLAVLSSPALDTLGITMRNALQVRDVNFLATNQYDVSAHLFVLSTANEQTLRKDQAFPMQQFKKAELGGKYQLEDSEWKVYWFRKM